jgi:1-aminocyclopropane-1-carboxylate deaminase/D-cysteine desulfhydrase-like pyridoxal-dependent ACC family enzyme
VVTVLFEHWPELRARVPWVSLGQLPSPIVDASGVLREAGSGGQLWLKRDDQSSDVYGGNKLRLLEHLLAEALQLGASHVYSTGACGSNFALATALLAPSVGLTPGAISFPQPMTPEGEQSHRLVAARARLVEIPHWSLLPVAVERVRRAAERRGEVAVVLSQVRLKPESLFGYLAAGLELAAQVRGGDCPAPARIVLPIGSGATSAGVLAGLSLAVKLGIWRGPLPTVVAVRIAPWPLSRRARVLALAEKTLDCLAQCVGSSALALSRHELSGLELVTDQLGEGYPHPTPQGTAARLLFARAGLPVLDETYSAKAAAHALSWAAGCEGPLLFWCTKSSAPLPVAAPASVD